MHDSFGRGVCIGVRVGVRVCLHDNLKAIAEIAFILVQDDLGMWTYSFIDVKTYSARRLFSRIPRRHVT